MSETIIGTELDRRTLLRRAAAAGLLATPAAGLLSACGVGGGDDSSTGNQGQTSAQNPLGVDGKAPLEIVIFDGGYGDEYAKDIHEPLYKKKFPEATINHSATQEISQQLQPRFIAGNPPDFVNNSGTNVMDNGALVADGQLADLTPLLDAPSIDDPAKKVRDTLVPGTVDFGTLDGKPYILNYVLSIFGLWYNEQLFKARGWTPPTTWSAFTTLLDAAKADGKVPFAYAGANASYYQYRVILTSAAKIGGGEVLVNIDNLEDGAWTADAVRQAAEAWSEVGRKYMPTRYEGLRHTEVQLEQNQDKVALYPSGSWLENEQKSSTPGTYTYAVMAEPSITGSDRLPGAAIFAAPGEGYVVPSKAKNARGGMEYMRIMLSKEGARGFTDLNKSLTVVLNSAEGVQLSPGLASARALLGAAGTNAVFYRFDGWYGQLEQEARAATNALMFGRETAAQFCARMQKKADDIKKDANIKKFRR